jgi:hypothetical protein
MRSIVLMANGAAAGAVTGAGVCAVVRPAASKPILNKKQARRRCIVNLDQSQHTPTVRKYE